MTKRRDTDGVPIRRVNTIFTGSSIDQEAAPDHKTSGTFFFWALACDKCGCQIPARAATKGTLDSPDTGQKLPASSPLPHVLSQTPAAFMALEFPLSHVTLPTTIVALQLPSGKVICATFSPASPLKVGGAWKPKKWTDM